MRLEAPESQRSKPSGELLSAFRSRPGEVRTGRRRPRFRARRFDPLRFAGARGRNG